MIPSPSSQGKRRTRVIALAVLVGLILMGSICWFLPALKPLVYPGTGPAGPTQSSQAQPIDTQAVRDRAWAKIAARLDETDQSAAREIDSSLNSLNDFFADRKEGTRPFANEILSLRGKWAFVRSKLPNADSDAHFKFLNEKFQKHVFKPDDLKVSIDQVITSYVSVVQGIENQLLVKIRADLNESQLWVSEAIPAFESETVFRREYQKMLEDVAVHMARDLGIDVAREVASFVAVDVAATIALRVAAGIGARLGISAGILGTGLASGWTTLGIGIVAAIVIDITFDWLSKLAGYDPVGQVAEKVDQTLGQVKALLVDGDPDAVQGYAQLRRLEKDDADAEVRKACQKAADGIEKGGKLGLHRELQSLHERRAGIRREALKRLILKGEQ